MDDRVGTHWTTYHGRVELPLTIEGGPVQLSYRLVRVLPETAVVQVLLDGRPVDGFTCRGGAWQERHLDLGALPPTPVRISFEVDSHDRRDLGLKMDWVRLDLGDAETRARLRGWARLRPVALVAILIGLALAAGWGVRGAALLAAPWSAAATASLWVNAWWVHRLLTGLPEALALFGLAGVLLLRLMARAEPVPDAIRDRRGLAALCLTAFLLRGAALNHPDFYYSDLLVHARVVATLREAGLDFLRTPSEYLWGPDSEGGAGRGPSGLWRKDMGGRSSGMPYSPAFHALFVGFASGDGLLTALKLGSAALSVLPLAALFLLARHIGASPWGALLMVLVPTYMSRLALGIFPALLGHAADMALLCWMASRLHRVTEEPRTWLAGALGVSACQLAYVSSITNLALFLGALAVFVGVDRGGRRGVRDAAAVLGMGLFGSLVSVLLYYHHFLAPLFHSGVALPGSDAGPRYPVQGFLAFAFARTGAFFGVLYPILALAGLWLLRRSQGRLLLGAWLATYLLLLLLRAKVPDVFRYGHETLFVTPLVCLLAGESLDRLWVRGGWARWAGGLLAGVLAVQGLRLQWQALAEQLGNAR